MAAQSGFTQKDRELLIELKVKMQEIDKRFEQIDKRFEEMDKRFGEVDKRFEDVDKRFDEIDKRFGEIITFMWMLVAIFSSITGATIAFALWDRRTMIRPFEDKMKRLEEGKLNKLLNLLNVMRKLAETDPKLAELLRQFNLL